MNPTYLLVMITDVLECWTRYPKAFDGWNSTFEWLLEHESGDLVDGTIDLANGIRLITSTYQSKPVTTCCFEAHERYMDIQYVMKGMEYIHWLPDITKGKHVPYSSEKDIEFYDIGKEGHASTRILMEAGTFVVFWPGEWHMPCVSVDRDESSTIKKMVVKVPRKLLT